MKVCLTTAKTNFKGLLRRCRSTYDPLQLLQISRKGRRSTELAKTHMVLHARKAFVAFLSSKLTTVTETKRAPSTLRDIKTNYLLTRDHSIVDTQERRVHPRQSHAQVRQVNYRCRYLVRSVLDAQRRQQAVVHEARDRLCTLARYKTKVRTYAFKSFVRHVPGLGPTSRQLRQHALWK